MDLLNNIFQDRKRVLIIIGIILIVLITILTIIYFVSSNQVSISEEEISDPASQETITTSNIEGQDGSSPIYFGFSELYDNHTDAWVAAVKAAITLHARNQNYELTRVSLLKDSLKEYSQDDPNDRNNGFRISEFKIVLNIDNQQIPIKATFDNSGLKIEIFDNSGLKIANYATNLDSHYIALSNSLPNKMYSGPSYRSSFTEDNIPNIAYGIDLPPIIKNDDLRVYFACPLPNQTETDNCVVYKYDFYY